MLQQHCYVDVYIGITIDFSQPRIQVTNHLSILYVSKYSEFQGTACY